MKVIKIIGGNIVDKTVKCLRARIGIWRNKTVKG